LYCWDYPDVAAELEDEVVQVGCCHGPQCGELGGCLCVVEYVERPVACGAAAQVGVVERGAVVGAQGYRRDARGLLGRPGQGPFGLGAPGGLRPDAGGGDLSGAQEQVLVVSSSARRAYGSMSGTALANSSSFSRRELAPPWVRSRRSVKWRSRAPVGSAAGAGIVFFLHPGSPQL